MLKNGIEDGEELAELRAWPLQFGTFFTARDVARAGKVTVLGAGARDQLFGPGADPTGETIGIRNQPFTVIGVLAPKGQSATPGQDQDDTAIVPYTTMQKRVQGWSTSPASRYRPRKACHWRTQPRPNGPHDVTAQVASLLRARHRIAPVRTMTSPCGRSRSWRPC